MEEEGKSIITKEEAEIIINFRQLMDHKVGYYYHGIVIDNLYSALESNSGNENDNRFLDAVREIIYEPSNVNKYCCDHNVNSPKNTKKKTTKTVKPDGSVKSTTTVNGGANSNSKKSLGVKTETKSKKTPFVNDDLMKEINNIKESNSKDKGNTFINVYNIDTYNSANVHNYQRGGTELVPDINDYTSANSMQHMLELYPSAYPNSAYPNAYSNAYPKITDSRASPTIIKKDFFPVKEKSSSPKTVPNFASKSSPKPSPKPVPNSSPKPVIKTSFAKKPIVIEKEKIWVEFSPSKKCSVVAFLQGCSDVDIDVDVPYEKNDVNPDVVLEFLNKLVNDGFFEMENCKSNFEELFEGERVGDEIFNELGKLYKIKINLVLPDEVAGKNKYYMRSCGADNSKKSFTIYWTSLDGGHWEYRGEHSK